MTTSKQKRKPTDPVGAMATTHQPREIEAAEFKMRCRELLDEVERSRVEVTITKHGRPVARLLPVHAPTGRFCGSLKGMVLGWGDIVSPTSERWEGDESNFP